MSQLIALDNVSLAYGLDHLLDHAKFQMQSGERVCLIGRNGAGKSSFLKIIDGVIQPDSGTVWRKPALRIARLAQDLPQDIQSTVFEFVAEGLAETGHLLAQYHALIARMSHSHSPEDMQTLERLQHAIDLKQGWQLEQTIHTMLTRLELQPDMRVTELSGGWQRRAALAQALVTSPELLLLDEPTNHLDVEAIQWLEEQLLSSGVGLLFITHDRALLQRLATRIIELDRGNLTSWPGDYAQFLRHKEELLHAEAQQNAEFDKKLAQEEKWIRQGIKARRTRNEGRVRALKAMRVERSQRREVQGKASFTLNEATKSGQLVVEVEHLTQVYQEKPVIHDFSLRIMRGDRIGLLGPNGIGKSTLLKLLLGEVEPQVGKITRGTRLEIAYFDQLRAALDPEKTVMDNVAGGSDFIDLNGKRRHIMSYLSDFLFTPQRARTPVKALSGGECNRLLLAKLFSLPSNLLVLDEPTNDLDIETLELLEDLLSDYAGTLLVVSHDRTFLDNVVTSTLVFEGGGKIVEYIGGYQDWLRQRPIAAPVEKRATPQPVQHATKPKDKTKLSYKEQKELAELPAKIERLEKEQAELVAIMSDPDFYKRDQALVKEKIARATEIEAELEKAYQKLIQ